MRRLHLTQFKLYSFLSCVISTSYFDYFSADPWDGDELSGAAAVG